MVDIPRTLDDVTANWLSGATGWPVAAITKTVIGQGEGFMGQLARVALEPGPAAPDDMPCSVIVKIPTADPGGQAMGAMQRVWEREARFYREIAPRIDMRVPRCHVNEADPETMSYCLVLEDLAPMRPGDQVVGATPAQARRAIVELARFHATWFEHPDLESLTWMPDLTDPMINAVPMLFEGGWSMFLDQYGTKVPERVCRWAEVFVKRIPDWITDYQSLPITISHGDFRLDNMFFDDPADPGSGEGSFAMVDWQLSMRVPGTSDLTYFVLTNLTPEVRRAHEVELVELYLQTLLDAGVPADRIDRDMVWRGYREGTLLYVVMFGGSLLTLDPANERGRAFLDSLIHRVYTAADDLDVGQML